MISLPSARAWPFLVLMPSFGMETVGLEESEERTGLELVTQYTPSTLSQIAFSYPRLFTPPE